MAVQTQKPISVGGWPCRYWKIGSALIDYSQGQVVLWLHGWIDHDLRLANAQPQSSIQLTLPDSSFPERCLHNFSTELAYKVLKLQGENEAGSKIIDLERSMNPVSAFVFLGALDC